MKFFSFIPESEMLDSKKTLIAQDILRRGAYNFSISYSYLHIAKKQITYNNFKSAACFRSLFTFIKQFKTPLNLRVRVTLDCSNPIDRRSSTYCCSTPDEIKEYLDELVNLVGEEVLSYKLVYKQNSTIDVKLDFKRAYSWAIAFTAIYVRLLNEFPLNINLREIFNLRKVCPKSRNYPILSLIMAFSITRATAWIHCLTVNARVIYKLLTFEELKEALKLYFRRLFSEYNVSSVLSQIFFCSDEVPQFSKVTSASQKDEFIKTYPYIIEYKFDPIERTKLVSNFSGERSHMFLIGARFYYLPYVLELLKGVCDPKVVEFFKSICEITNEHKEKGLHSRTWLVWHNTFSFIWFWDCTRDFTGRYYNVYWRRRHLSQSL